MNEQKFCPVKATGPNSYAQDAFCEEEKCAWWCRWNESCAIVAIPDTLYDVARNGEDAP